MTLTLALTIDDGTRQKVYTQPLDLRAIDQVDQLGTALQNAYLQLFPPVATDLRTSPDQTIKTARDQANTGTLTGVRP